jgi:hypothetical protein
VSIGFLLGSAATVITKDLIAFQIVFAVNSDESTFLTRVVKLTEEKIALIAGGGKYGSGALKHFLRQRDLKVVVCDEDSHSLASALVRTEVGLAMLRHPIQIKEPTLIVGDAVKVAVRFLTDGIVPEIIIPCVPFHFAGKVLTGYMTSKCMHIQPSFEPLERAFEKARLVGIEYRLDQENALVVASRMPFDMQCAPGCQQPGACPVTGRKLSKPMFQLMNETLNHASVDIVKVLRSRLIAPNVGGFSGEELKQTLDLCVKSEPCTIAIGTSCGCHAVANMLRIIAE